MNQVPFLKATVAIAAQDMNESRADVIGWVEDAPSLKTIEGLPGSAEQYGLLIRSVGLMTRIGDRMIGAVIVRIYPHGTNPFTDADNAFLSLDAQAEYDLTPADANGRQFQTNPQILGVDANSGQAFELRMLSRSSESGAGEILAEIAVYTPEAQKLRLISQTRKRVSAVLAASA